MYTPFFYFSTKSLPREQPASYGKPYQRSEFNLDVRLVNFRVHASSRLDRFNKWR